MNSTFLTKIAKLTVQRVESERATRSTTELRAMIHHEPIDFLARLQNTPPTRVIAEIKRRSPSAGDLAALDAPRTAHDYVKAGAAAISVLTEPTYFGGSLEDLAAVRAHMPAAALLMKDFVLDPYQLLQARAFGADAVLLIHALLGKELRDFFHRAVDLGLTPLVEVHDREELEDAMHIGARLVGVNNRNLQTLEVDLETSRRLALYRQEGVFLVSESGIKSNKEIQRLEAIGYDAFLVGTSLVRGHEPEAALRSLLLREVGT